MTVSQATWYSFRSDAAAEAFTFTFQTSCSSGATTATAQASAVAVRFSGVNPVFPIDVDATGTQIYQSDNNVTASTAGSKTFTPKAVLPFHRGDEVIALYGAGSSTALTSSCSGFVSKAGSATTTAYCGKNNVTAGQVVPLLALPPPVRRRVGNTDDRASGGLE